MKKMRHTPERWFTYPELVTLPRRYPLPLPLRYRTTPKHGTLRGVGLATTMSSQDIIFAAGDGLKPGMEAEIAVAWPTLLDGYIRLQLVLEATITVSEDGIVVARILAYDFRTRRAVEAGHRTENGWCAASIAAADSSQPLPQSRRPLPH